MKKTRLSRDSRQRLRKASAYYDGGGLGARSYDLIYGEAAAAAADFFISYANKFGAPVLELGAGTGLISWPVAAAGYRIVAVDISAAMLDLAEYKRVQYAATVAARISFVRGDMVNLKLAQTFATVIMPGSSFQHLLTRNEQEATLRNIHAHLVPGGGLVLTLLDSEASYCASADPSRAIEMFEDPASGHRIRRRFLADRVNRSDQILTETILIEQVNKDGEIVDSEQTSWSLARIRVGEMRDLIQRCGFEIEAQFSDFDGAPPGHGAEQIWVARRP